MENDDVAPPGFDTVEHVPEVVEIEVVADRHENIAGTRAHRFRTQFAFQFQVELIHLDVGHAAMSCLAAPKW